MQIISKEKTHMIIRIEAEDAVLFVEDSEDGDIGLFLPAYDDSMMISNDVACLAAVCKLMRNEEWVMKTLIEAGFPKPSSIH